MEKAGAENRPLSHLLPEPLGDQCQYPWLIYYHGKTFFRDVIFCSISSSGPVSSKCKRIPELRDNLPLAYSHGRLLLSNGGTLNHFLWNPTTLESIDLPPLESSSIPEQEIKDQLLSSPADPNCLVLLFSSEFPWIIYCRPGHDKECSVYDYGGQSLRCGLLSNPVKCRGKMYVANETSPQFMDLLLITADEYNKLSLCLVNKGGPNLHHPLSYTMNRFLVESGDELFSILYFVDEWGSGDSYQEALVFEVDKCNFSTNEWEKVKSLSGRAIFLGLHYSLSCPVDVEAGSCIYDTNPEDESLYKYNMEDESITVYLPCRHLLKQWLLLPTWIMPPDSDYIRQQGRLNAKDQEKQAKENTEIQGKEINIVKSILENTTEEKETHLLHLPPELLTLIAGRLISFVVT